MAVETIHTVQSISISVRATYRVEIPHYVSTATATLYQAVGRHST